MRAPSLFLLSLAPVLAMAGPAAAQHRTHGHSTHGAATSHHSDTAKPDAAKPAAASSAAPKAIGKFDDWEAATHAESGETICYAFTRATSSTPSVPGRGPGSSDVVLTVTQRPGMRDVVAISAGFAYAPGAEVTVQTDAGSFPFYTAQRSAFARDGHAVVAAFGKSAKAVAKSPGPHGAEVTDSFSLRGFSPAYAAVNKACAGSASGKSANGKPESGKPASHKSGKAR